MKNHNPELLHNSTYQINKNSPKETLVIQKMELLVKTWAKLGHKLQLIIKLLRIKEVLKQIVSLKLWSFALNRQRIRFKTPRNLVLHNLMEHSIN